jgi:choline-sulfatase
MESAGLLENTVIVLTSDHGEMNERGISGHSNNTLYEPLIRVPLLIFDPGRKARADVNVPTSAVDLLATLLHLTGQSLPEWNEGVILPPFNPAAPNPERSVYVLRAMKNEQDAPITADRSIALIKGRYKLHYYADYPELKKTGAKELIYLFDVEADPEELVDLAGARPDVAAELLKELKAKLAEVNQPYIK